MRLFLSSYRFGNHPKRFADLLRGKKRIGIVTNAQDVYEDLELRQQKLGETVDELKNIGLDGEELDLRHYFSNQTALEDKLKEYDGIWVRGGNAFVLRKAMAYSGFDKAIVELLAGDEIVYGGYSAGACVLGKTMHGLEHCDEPNAIPAGYKRKIIWDGLNIIPYTIVPHYKSEHPEADMIDVVVKHMKADGINFKTLRDGEVIVIDGHKEDFLK